MSIDESRERDWLQPDVESLIVDGQMPEMVLTVVVGVDLDTGKRAVNWTLASGDYGGDHVAALGAMEVVKAQLLSRMVQG